MSELRIEMINGDRYIFKKVRPSYSDEVIGVKIENYVFEDCNAYLSKHLQNQSRCGIKSIQQVIDKLEYEEIFDQMKKDGEFDEMIEK